MGLVLLDRKSARAPWSVARGRREASASASRRSSSAENEIGSPLDSFSAVLSAMGRVVASVNAAHRSVPTATFRTSHNP